LLVFLIHQKKILLDDDKKLYALCRSQQPPEKNAPQSEMIFINGGTFVNSENKVITLEPYSIMKGLVTQSEYWNITNDNPSYKVDAALPVDGVHWYAAVDFCNKKSERRNVPCAYEIDKVIPDRDNLSPLDHFRWKVDFIPGAAGFRLPTADEWEYARKKNESFTVSEGLTEWCWDFCGDLFESQFYHNTRFCWTLSKRGRFDKLREGAEGRGGCINVNDNRTNYGKKCFSYAGNYGFRLARNAL
jgi:formylglycine-generating enzyme required for sulfatase activity